VCKGFYDKALHQFNSAKIAKIAPKPITVEARSSFVIAFGISIERQIYLETKLSEWNVNMVGLHSYSCTFDVQTWSDWRPEHLERYLGDE